MRFCFLSEVKTGPKTIFFHFFTLETRKMSAVEIFKRCCEEKIYEVDAVPLFNARRATFNFLLTGLYKRIKHEEGKIAHFISDSSYFIAFNGPISEETVTTLREEIQKLIESDKKIELVEMDSMDLINMLIEQGHEEKAFIVQKLEEETVLCAKFEEIIDIVYEPMVLNFNELGLFKLYTFDQGVLLQLPTARNPKEFAVGRLAELQQKMLNYARKQSEIFDVQSVLQIAEYCSQRTIEEMEKFVDKISDEQLNEIEQYIISQYPEKRVIGIAGPSSSGKTTLSLPIKERLSKKGYQVISIAIDDYYHHRPNMVKKKDGIDFEHINSIQGPLLAERIKKLINGEEIPVRHFDFITGFGSDLDEKLKLQEKGFVIIEGIHGINPDLLNLIDPLKPIRIYVSPMTPVNIDDYHPLCQRDICLMRRVIRDNRERNYSPRTTIGFWPGVCDGEERNICPYVGSVEYFFNSSFIYELRIIAEAGREIFEKALVPEPNEDPKAPMTLFVTSEVMRILRILKLSGHQMIRVRRNSGRSEFVGEEFNDKN